MAVEMKDTGIDWIGKIPKEWDVNKIKYSAILKGRIGWQGLTTAEYRDEGPFLITGIDFADGSIDWEHCEHVELKRWAEDPYIQITNGDLLITKDGTVGKTAIVEGLNDKATLNSGVLLIRTDDTCNRRYLYWILNSQLFWKWFNVINSGNSTIIHLYQGDFNNFVYPVPDITEQKKIADFLDKQTSKVDAIIKTNEQQLEILKKYKKSLISQTVTKGLDNNVKMKDSGIDWIGKIPDGWEIAQLKRFVKFRTGATPPSEYPEYFMEEEEWYTPGDFTEQIYLDTSQRKVSSKAYSKKIVPIFPENTVLIVGIGATAGKIGFSKKICSSNQQITALINNTKVFSRYLMYYMQSQVQTLRETANYTTLPILNNQTLGIFPFIKPDYIEQKRIADYLDEQCSKIDFLITKKQQTIDTIQKYKKSLIYEYVTGKKRIK